jgi:hypothetical protein
LTHDCASCTVKTKRIRNCWKIADPEFQDEARTALENAAAVAARLKRAGIPTQIQINAKSFTTLDGAPCCPVLEFPDVFWAVADRASSLRLLPFDRDRETNEMLQLVRNFQSVIDDNSKR